LLVVAVVAAFIYAAFAQATSGACAGGFTGGGGFVDRLGQETDVAPQCLSLQMGPSPFVLLAMAMIVLWAVRRVARWAVDEQAAVRTTDRATLAVAVVAGASLVIAQVWFALLPIGTWDPAGDSLLIYPFPFASVEMSVEPMPMP
jgi:hypothetical protein